jgi:regulator of nonsense transcripts 2
VSEAVSAILDAPLKSKDVKAAIRVCCMLHGRYPDFGSIMKERLLDMISSDAMSVAKRKTRIKIFFCLLRVGVVENVFPDLMNTVRCWTRVKMDISQKESHTALAMLNTFLKAGGVSIMEPIRVFNGEKEVEGDCAAGVEEAIGCMKKVEESKGLAKELWCLKKEHSDKLKERVFGCYDAALAALDAAWSSLTRLRKDNNVILNTRGDLSEKRMEDFKDACQQFESFKKVLGSLSYTLCRELPEYEFDEDTGYGEESFRVVEQGDGEEAVYFDDPDDVALYQTLPPLSELVPPILLGQKQHTEMKEPMVEADGEDGDDSLPSSSEEDSDEEIATPLGSDSTISLSSLILKLPECVSIDICDSFVVEFCKAGGSKPNSQKALCKALQRPPFGAMQILPFYSRIIASLCPWFPLIKETMVKFLQREFYGLKKKIDIATDTLEPRLRNACFIAELIKFGIYPPGKAFIQLRSLFDDFSRHNVDTACCLVEHCGRYLYQRPDTKVRMKNMMATMVKIKNAKNLEQRHVALIDAAQATVYGTSSTQQRKTRTLEEEYIRHLIYSELASDNVTQVSTACRKFIWSKQSGYIHKKILSAVRKGKHSQISPLASLTKELAVYYPSFAVNIVDEVLEDILCGLENPDARTWIAAKRS